MRKQATTFAGTAAGAVMLIGTLCAGPAAASPALGRAPDPSVCEDTAHPPRDPVTEGGCIAIDRTKGNCVACHAIAGATSGNVAPPLVDVARNFPDRARLRAEIVDPTRFNPGTVMPPFGRNLILTPREIDRVVDFILTL